MYQKLRSLRLKKGYRTGQMAEFLGISKAFYSQIENGKRKLSYDMAVEIARIFHLQPDSVFYHDHITKEVGEK